MFFSFNLNQTNYDDPTNQWPTDFTFGSSRLWDTGVTWKDIEAQQGVYTFTELDKQINLSISRGITDILYTAGKVPTFYGGGATFANPPSDVDTGNVNYANFVFTLGDHIRSTFPTITFTFEEWNEPNLQQFWTGTAAQLLEMSNTAYNILHPMGYKVTSPSGSGGTAIGNFILSYLTACNGTYPFDIFAYHAYLENNNPDPSSGMDLILNDIKVKKTSGFPGLANMDTWFTEGSWGLDTDYTPVMTDAQKANYLSIQYAKIQAAGGQAAKVKRYYWYSLNNSHGFGVLATGIPVVLNQAGLAYQSLQKGASMTQTVINFPVPASVLPVTVNDNVGVSLQQNGDVLEINPIVPPPNPTITGVTVSGPATLTQGATAQYTAKVTGTGSFNPAVTWKASDGTISSTGLFTAPRTSETITVTAVSVQDTTKSGSLPVAVSSPSNTVKVQASGGDDTSALQAALNSAATLGKILEMTTAGGTWHIMPITVPKGTQLLIDPGVLITDQAAYSSHACMFNINTSNVTITATGAFAQMPLSLAQSIKDGQEYRHCVVIGQAAQASTISITGLSVTESGGDGLYITNSTGVSISNFKTSKNYRNGFSCTGKVNGLTFSNFTSSSNMRAGIDFEPNANTDFLMNIVGNNVETDNNAGGGMSFGPYNLDGSSQPVSITINGFASVSDGQYGIFFTNDNDKETGSYPPGLITVNNANVSNSAFGGAYGRFAAGGLQIVFNNLNVQNSNVKGTDPHYQMSSAVGVELNGGQAGVPGNVNFNMGSISNTGKGMQNYFQMGSGAKNTTFKATGSLSGATNSSAKTVFP